MKAITLSEYALHKSPAEAPVPHPGLVRASIASILDRELDVMPRDDLIDMIRMSSMTNVEGERLADGELAKLAFLVRRVCRNQLDSHRQQCGQPLLWSEAI